MSARDRLIDQLGTFARAAHDQALDNRASLTRLARLLAAFREVLLNREELGAELLRRVVALEARQQVILRALDAAQLVAGPRAEGTPTWTEHAQQAAADALADLDAELAQAAAEVAAVAAGERLDVGADQAARAELLARFAPPDAEGAPEPAAGDVEGTETPTEG